MSKFLCALLASVLLNVAQAPLEPNQVSILTQSLRWRNIGPLRGGRSLAVAGSFARPLEYFFGAVGGVVWKTTDGCPC